MSLLEFAVLALACFRATRLVTTDVVFSRPREWFWRRFPPETTMLGYLSTCDWCTSVWVGSLLTISYTIFPSATFIASLPLALSAVAGYLAARL